MKRFIKNDDIEFKAEEILHNYQVKFGNISQPPIPLENILMQELELTIEYDEIIHPTGLIILGGLCPYEKKVIVNSQHLQLFNEKPGLERSTIGHEAGHWVFEVDTSLLNHPTFEFNEDECYVQAQTKNNKRVFAFRGNIKSTPNQPLDLIKKIDSSDQTRVVNRFNAALNMPILLIKKHIVGVILTEWSSIYELAKIFDVTPTAMKVRLEQLGYIYVKDKKIYTNSEEIDGQLTLRI